MTTKNISELREADSTPAPTYSSGALSVFSNIQSFEAAQRIAKALMTADVVPSSYRQNMGNTLIALELAQRTGASVLAVMQNIAVIHGKPSWEAKFLIGAVNTCGKFSPLRYEMLGEEGKDSWGCRAWAYDLRTDEKLDGPKVTIAMAKSEGWHQKAGSKWQTMPEVMLRYRAASFWVKQFAPEISLGMQTTEEMHDTFDAQRSVDGSFKVSELQEQEPAEAETFPKKIGEGQNDWVDCDGLAYNPVVFGWDRANNQPSHVGGRFRVARGKSAEAAQYRVDHALPGPPEDASGFGDME